MTRILYWNIENFALNKIRNTSFKRQKGASQSQATASIDRRDYILEHLAITNAGVVARPDIVVVVEVETVFTSVGRLASGAGEQGARVLLADIRNTTGNPNWMLVPPLQTGPTEAVGVFYDSTNLVFTGPWRWPGGIGPSFDPAANAAPGTVQYAAPYNTTLPNRVIPANATNAGQSERAVAARTRFTRRNGIPRAGQFINKQFERTRAPYMVRFAELNGLGAVARELTLFAIHAPASTNLAGTYLQQLAGIAQIIDGLGANEARFVLGDFNVNLMRRDATRTRAPAYAQLAANYTLGIDRPGNPPNPIDGWLGYFATHVKDKTSATYWAVNPNTDEANFYPGYGYIGSSLIGNFFSIDNILSRYGVGVGAGGPMQNVSVINGIVGSNYNVILPPIPGTPPPGTYGLPIRMADAARFGAPAAQAPAFGVGRQTSFRGWDNYGFIRSTSDHLAIVADV